MTKEECIGLLKRYAEYNGIGIPNLAGCREAMRMAAELLERPSLPSNLDEAAEKYAREEMMGGLAERSFKAGAELQYQKDRAEFAKLKAKEWQEGFDNGKAEALKDLPRWKREQGEMELTAYGIIGGGIASQENPRVYLDGHSIDLYSLEKLPKED